MKCDHLLGRIFDGDVYILASDVMEAIAELKEKLDKAIAERDGNQVCIDALKKYIYRLKEEKAQLNDKLEQEQLLRSHWNEDDYAMVNELERLSNENEKLKQKLESVQASMYADVVDANMEVRRLKKALYIAHAIKAKFKWWWMSECKHNESCKLVPDPRKIKRFTNSAWVCSKSQEKCRAKAEEYK